MTKFDFKLVGKIGSMALINKYNQDMDYNIISRLSRELKPGMIWVTSGATEIGRLDYIKRNGKEIDIPLEDAKTDYSSQGQSILMATYRQFVDSRYSIRQILVEHQHFNDSAKREHLKRMLMRAPLQNAIPIINYNDAVSYEETRKLEIQNLALVQENVVQCVDNDETASQIAALVNTEYLLILSNIDGIYDNPEDPSSLVKEIRGKDYDELLQNIDEYQNHCKGASRAGAGGAKAKLEYIKKPLENGTTVIIANSKYSIKDIMNNSVPRTIIHSDK